MTTPLTDAVPTSAGAAPAAPAPALRESLRNLYLVRFAVAVVWAALLLPVSESPGPVLTTLLVAYPLFDAAAVLSQLRAGGEAARARTTERINVVVSVVVAVALGVTVAESIAAALAVWGAWAIGSGATQLVTALRNRDAGGQVPQMLSGGLSVLAGAAFLAQGVQGADSIAGVGGYAVLGGVFFLVSAVRLTVLLRRAAA